ncbi:hypothetical protein [Streptomyces sp. NRRL WC-3742]|uniref:hypothetical protein n=1 Tax=Streptomyces sp. NRRL WC-3742 TaxID=1463934 RepID=UPI0006905242|nr:hypothetical protein [Streptomyces sp. NRRL WC-3742]
MLQPRRRSSPAANPGITDTSNAKNNPAINPIAIVAPTSTRPAARLPEATAAAGAENDGGAVL